MVATSVPAAAVSPPGSMEVPDPVDWGVPAQLELIQGEERDAIDEPAVVSSAEGMLSGEGAYEVARTPATGPYYLHRSPPAQPTVPDVVELARSTPNGTLPAVLQLLLDQPLKISILVESGEHSNWIDAFLRPSLFRIGEDGRVVLLNLQRWEYADIDNDTTTGNAAGFDMRVRMRPVLENRTIDYGVLPLHLDMRVRGGLALEVERLGNGSEDLPLDITFFKSFRYSGINYTWFLDYEVDHLPSRSYMSITAENVNASFERGQMLDLIMNLIGNGSALNGSRLSEISGPYTIHHRSEEDLTFIHATLGYLKIAQSPIELEPRLEEADWLRARVLPPGTGMLPPREFSLWLDSPSFNRTFDHLNWTADRRALLELEYFDARENATQARALVDSAPRNLRLRIGEAMEDVGRVAKIHYTSTESVGLISFDAWDFAGPDRRKYLHTHVELHDMPTDIWLNGTIDVGGQEYALLRPDPRAGSFIPQMMDAVMVGLASKLFNIGQTLRALPQSLLDMPDKEGYMNLQLPREGEYLGMMEMHLTSDHYVTVAEGTDFLAFYNDSIGELEGNMVQTGFALRLLDIRAIHAEFKDRKQIVLDSRYNREFRALFIDEANQANASLRFSNMPHNISLELMEDQIIYMGDGTVDRVEYTSEVGEQYIQFRMDGVPGGLHFLLGEDTTGLDVLTGEIDTITVRVTDGVLRSMDGDHLLLERSASGSTAVSLRISGMSSLLLRKGEQNTVALETGAKPFNIIIADEAEGFHLRAQLDPLPRNIEAEVSDILGLSDIDTPSLQDVTSVLEFASVIYSMSELADDVLVAMGDATASIIEGLGGFSSNVSFSFDGDQSMDLAATVSHTGNVPVDQAPWVHGVWVNMLPSPDGEVLMDARVFLTGIAPKGSIGLVSTAGTTHLDLTLEGFVPDYDHLLLVVNGSSLIEGGGGKDVWLYMSDLVTPMDLAVVLDMDADVSIGGRMAGGLELASSNALGPLHMRTRIRGENVATAEVLLASAPRRASMGFEYASDIGLDLDMSDGLPLLFLKMSRNLAHAGAPAVSVTLHDVPSLLNLSVSSGSDFDMDATTPLANLPVVRVSTNAPGLDALVRMEGRAMGNKADLFLDLRDVEELAFTLTGDEYRMSAAKLEFLHLSVGKLAYSGGTWFQRIDVVATDLVSLTVRVHMVFGVYPLMDMDDLVATGLQLGLVGRTRMGGGDRDLDISIFEVPMSVGTMPRSHSDGLLVQDAEGHRRLFVPAPITTLMGTLMG